MLERCPGPIWDDAGFSACVRERYLEKLPPAFLFASLAAFSLHFAYHSYHASKAGAVKLPVDIANVEESPVRRAENEILRKAAEQEASDVMTSLNLEDQGTVADAFLRREFTWSIAGLLLVSWAIPLLLIAATARRDHAFAPLLSLSAGTLAAWLSVTIRRNRSFLKILALVAVYALFQIILAFAEMRAQPDPFNRLLLALSILQLLSAVTTTPTDQFIQKRLLFRASDAPPEMTRPSLLSTGYLIYFFTIIRQAAAVQGGVQPPLLTPELSAATVLSEFRALGQKGGLTRRLLRFLFWDWVGQVLWSASSCFIQVGPLVFLRALLNELSEPDYDQTKAAILALLIPTFQALRAVFDGMALIKGRHMCVKARAICSGEIYAKTLRRQDIAKPQDDESSSSSGRISNMVSADVSQISEMFAYLHFIFPSLPIIVGITLWLLFDTLGKSAFVGLAVMLALLPIQYAIGRMYNALTAKLLNASDKRLHLLQEVLHGIRLIRFFAWQDSFAQRLADLRQREISILLRRSLLDISAETIYMSNAAAIGILTFFFHTKVFGQELSAASAFTTLAAFEMIKKPLEMLADMMAHIFQANISLQRISAYLEEPDTAKWSDAQDSTDSRVGFSHATFDWGFDGSFQLKDLDMLFPEGKLSLIAGSVGSGKSALLLSLLGEIRLKEGKRYLPADLLPDDGAQSEDGFNRSVAYCAQTAFLMSDSLRANILFGTDWDEDRYRKVLAQCALSQDLKQLPAGDQTLIGERGTVLSGGQKMRVALARALYSRARTILLDDVLAAVDAQTAHMLVKTLSGDLLQGRTCILVTHSLPLCLPVADFVVVLEKGQVKFSGLPSEASDHLGIELQTAVTEPTLLGEAHLTAPDQQVDLTRAEEKKDEMRSAGSVSWDVYAFYFKARGGLLTWTAIFAGYCLSQVCQIFSSAWLGKWAKSYSTRALNVVVGKRGELFLHSLKAGPAAKGPDYYMKVYLALSLGYIAILVFRTIVFRLTTLRAARRVYQKLSATVLGAQMRFFDTTPVGQVINRMSRDTKVVDTDIGSTFSYFFFEIFAFSAVLIAVAFVLPQFLFVAAVTAALYAATIKLYLTGSREFKRLESVTRSPIFSLFGETMAGSITIRAYAATSRFLKRSLYLQNENARPFYTLWLANRWLSVTTELESAATVLGIALGIVLVPGIDSSIAGFCLSLGLSLPERLLWLGRLGADVEIAANSVERVKEYLDLEQESTAGTLPPAAWPSSSGTIRVQDLKAFYGPDSPPVLKGLTFDIQPRSKVAIVGRTGSGKSTLALAFFRFIKTTGLLEIDGLDISKLSLNELRRRLTIIAQDATLFSGTIRSNLDPFGDHEDARLWDVLHRVKLAAPSRAASTTELSRSDDTLVNDGGSPVTSLDQEVAEGGNNLSQGQRQLVALARGLLKLSHSKLLILDEASASLDADTDAFIQRTLREELNDATLICIAHRLDTVIDYDKVLVLGNGEILEYDSPSALLQNPEGHFYGLCKQSGDAEFDRLKSLANTGRSGAGEVEHHRTEH